ncbi:serine/threonine-protein phosphatase PGAM5, mitochondrial isoform X1 [Lingula anatina]|uniref:Serine/threonine-protein phosphatase PGAM5, mitochondrial n=1 Tax=Lingula anatina TaxID=7574 RepID=A0A1S3J2N0_LINAN|nr:serine/threonine-protein phosphatase PGAM5, mitochondrial isoform X1 [Lingula anatina]XP_023933121.1 serine/threonine-protein phosphatase PGAM5, mitochondrial isoform X1 [Lingula anatina]XP_023933122.1 serine/threonine-protein phosphatase PGAM5, mitochondrial isoform X1 [Lingula anatina]|eukprot:XP_013404672.1 serine/threonine-protein phosphatase PGAM5, mitochondrial isoform X1 [Lingula anatina]
MSGRLLGVLKAVGMAGGAITGGWMWSKYLSPVVSASTLPSPDREPVLKWDYNWDKREPDTGGGPLDNDQDRSFEPKLSSKKPTATRHLILIRHGLFNREGKCDDTQRELTELGREQAEFTGKRLKSLNLPYTSLVYSTMKRATETAQIILKHLDPNLPVKSCDLLREGGTVPPEPAFGYWKADHLYYQEGARIEAAFRHYFHRADPSQKEDSYEILVCHANVIRYLTCRGLQLPPEVWLRFRVHHCSMTHIMIKPTGQVTALTIGEYSHLPPDKLVGWEDYYFKELQKEQFIKKNDYINV